MKTSIIHCLVCLMLFSGCSKDLVERAADNIPAAEMLNLSYGSAAAQNFDLYLPASRNVANTPLLVLIHGGGWSSMDKADFRPYVDSLRRRLPGYAIANINYRLSNGTSIFFPTQENDVRAAIEFLYSKRNEYGFSDKFVLLGASAGAHLSLLQAYKYHSPVQVKAVIDFFGPTDLLDLYQNPASVLASPASLALVIGATPASNPAFYTQSSPVNFVSTPGAVPTIIFHGALDLIVRPAQSTMLQAKLQAQGIANQYVLYPNEGHGGWSDSTYIDAFNKIAVFLQTHVR